MAGCAIMTIENSMVRMTQVIVKIGTVTRESDMKDRAIWTAKIIVQKVAATDVPE